MTWGMIGAAAVTVVGGAIASKGANKAARQAGDAAATQAQIGLEQWDRYREIYGPIEQKIASDAQSYDSPENYALAAGDASATVSSQFGKARERLSRTPGLDTSSPAYAASLADLEMSQAATDAVQQNAARQKVKDTAWARGLDAVSLGKGLPAQASTALASSAQISKGIADTEYQRSRDTAIGVGNLVSTGMDAWNKSQQQPTPRGQGSGFSMVDTAYDNFA